MSSIRRILVAVKDTRRKSSPAIVKAARLARALNARLELFHAISEPLVVDAFMFADQSLQKFESDSSAGHLKRLQTMAAPLLRAGIKVETAVEWDFPAHEAVIRRAHRTGADLIVAERHAERHVAPWVLRYTDWELLRRSPVPVLLVKKPRKYTSPRILAAVDPSHAFAKTSGLDKKIIAIAASVSAALRGQLHVVHAYVPTIIGMKEAELNTPDASQRIVRRAEELAGGRLEGVLRGRSKLIGPRRRHLVARHPVDAIPQVVQEIGCDIVVMGDLSRSGLKRLVIGNTAERLVDELSCDLLIVKPPAFISRVPARPRGPQLVAMNVATGGM
ncbi:MAG: universal stress protein [Steroidobacteraceae bacterium]